MKRGRSFLPCSTRYHGELFRRCRAAARPVHIMGGGGALDCNIISIHDLVIISTDSKPCMFGATRVLRPAGLYLIVSMSLEYPKPHPILPNIYENSLLSEAVFAAFEPSAPPVPMRVPARRGIRRQHPASNGAAGAEPPDFHVFSLRHNPRPNESTLALRQ
jgi:hypothetical protein